jgi:hypothetical protein
MLSSKNEKVNPFSTANKLQNGGAPTGKTAGTMNSSTTIGDFSTA